MSNLVPPGVAGLLGLLGKETWEDRVREGAWTSPKTNTRIRFDFEDLERTTPLNGTMFQFPGVNNGYPQRTGFGSREYPIRAFFSGPNHDKIATAFESGLLEPGVGRLEHPLYGRLACVPFGQITRNDALKTAANQTIIETSFFTTVGEIYPSSRPADSNEILGAIQDFDVKAASDFDRLMDLTTTVRKVQSKATIRGYLMKVSAELQSISDSVSTVNRAFRDLQSTVNLGLDVLIGQPLLLARQISDLIKAPGRALTGIVSRLDGYARLADSIFGDKSANPAEAFASGTSLLQRRGRITNDLHISDLFAANAVAGSVVATTIDGSFTTKPEAIAAAAALQQQLDALVTWRDAGFAALAALPEAGESLIDTGGSLQALQTSVATAVGFLVQSSFQLVPERRIVLDRNRTIIDLAAELYGSVDSRLDLLINSNKLTGDEILELPLGKTIAYYPG
jgi:prophage DNA circulation protein